MACSVKGCNDPMQAVFEIPDVPIRKELGVCKFHYAALMADEPWMLEGGHGDVLMGDDLPLDVVEWSVTKTAGHDVITFALGRDGIEREKVSFTLDPQDLRQICHVAGNGGHPGAFTS